MTTWSVDLTLQLGALVLEVALKGDARPTAIIGPNGAGKSTILRTIAGAYAPSRGTIWVGDTRCFDASEGVMLPPEARGVGYLPQGHGLLPHLRVLENVCFGAGPFPRRERTAAQARARALLEELGVAALADRRPAALSGGESQRVALARALMARPRLLLLDEPLAALDPTARRALRAVLQRYLGVHQMPAILVTHDLRDVLALDAQVCVVEAGRVTQVGHHSALAEAPATDFVAEFFLPAT